MAKNDIHKKPKTDVPRRRSKRNSARATPSPRNFEEMLKQAESLARESIYADACARMIKHEGPPFRLLDLPPELRMRIFDYMVFRPDPLDLGNLVAPLITAVSKQVRAECMAGFFALNTFQATVETNICLVQHMNSFCQRFGSLRAAKQHPHLHANSQYWLDLIYRVESRAGALRVEESTENWLNKIHPEVGVFRNVDLVLKDTLDHPALCASDPRAPQYLRSIWKIGDQNLNGREVFLLGLWRPMRLVPHFVSSPLDDTAYENYTQWPLASVLEILNDQGDDPAFEVFNFDALRILAYTIGHWGVY